MRDCKNKMYFKWIKEHRWSDLPYPGQSQPYIGLDTKAGQWPLSYLKRNCQGKIMDPFCDNKTLHITHPCDYFFDKELEYVKKVKKELTDEQIGMAKYFATGVLAEQLGELVMVLLHTYGATPAVVARILSVVGGAMNDAFVVTCFLKHLFDVPRIVQLDPTFETVIPTPEFPTYPSGYSVVSATVSVVLSYFFPEEATKLNKLAIDASLSRIYGGVNFKCDCDEGVKLGILIGNSIVESLKKQNADSKYLIDIPYTEFLDAPIIPNYLEVDAPIFQIATTTTAEAPRGLVGDLVWIDLNENGVQDIGEPGVPGVTVELITCGDIEPIATTVTDTNGNYLFENVEEGNYYVKFSGIPANYVFIQSNGVVNRNGVTKCFALGQGENKLDVDVPIVQKSEKFKQLTLQSELSIPCQKPDIGDILGQIVNVDIKDTYLINTPVATSYEGQKLTGYKLMVYGQIKLTMEYIACECSNGVYAANFSFPFSTFIIIPENEKDDQFEIVPVVEDAYQQMLDCRCTFTTIILLLTANNY